MEDAVAKRRLASDLRSFGVAARRQVDLLTTDQPGGYLWKRLRQSPTWTVCDLHSEHYELTSIRESAIYHK